MHQIQSQDYGQSIFCCHFRPLFAGMIVLIGSLFAWIMLDALFFNIVLSHKNGIGYAVLFGGILLISLTVVALGVLQLRHPMKFYDVTDSGIVIYLGREDAAQQPGFVPWDRVQSLEYVRHAVRTGNENGFSYFVKANVIVDEEWPPKNLHGYIPEEQAVLIDAFSGAPSGRTLLARIEAVWSEYAPEPVSPNSASSVESRGSSAAEALLQT